MNADKKWQAVIGLEVHVQLKTASKIFSTAATAYGGEPNTQACAISIALPGTLPVMNLEAARLAVRFGLAVGAKINRKSVFARKHYFYPDLPKGYQISQYEHPIVGAGALEIVVGDARKTIGITRAHLEEDAGKSLHETDAGITGNNAGNNTGIDLNRAGTPLLEIVSEPDLSSSAEAVAYLRKLHGLVKYLGVSDGNMQEGSFRCDANVSVKPARQKALGTRTELKNINSFRFVEKAIDFEIARQIEALEAGEKIVQETRLYDEVREQTRPMRSKEEAHDYRYFPDPDLPELRLSEEFIAQIHAELPELPAARAARWVADFGLPESDAANLITERELADYYDAVAAECDPKIAANWVLGDLAGALNKHGYGISESPVTASELTALLARIADKTISGKIAKSVFDGLWNGDGTVDEIIKKRGLQQITDAAELTKIIRKIIADNPTQAREFRAGKQKLLAFFVGQTMKATAGKANPAEVNRLLRELLT